MTDSMNYMEGPRQSFETAYFSLFTPAPLIHGSPTQAEDASCLGDWPQRLLHVPTMTSYGWQPGHKYGAYTKPRYNAISYTWGRYELRHPNEQPHVKAVDIGGVTWPIPRIDPSHFTTAQFQTLIRRSVEPSKPLEGYKYPSRANSFIDFVWLDIACINQLPDHPQKAQEIGRQARIFRTAKRVLIWLNKSGQKCVEDAIESLEQGAAIAQEDVTKIIAHEHQWMTIAESKLQFSLKITRSWLFSKATSVKSKLRHLLPAPAADIHKLQSTLTGDEPWLTAALASLEYLSRDRWFSSLWTLQEAFICQWAYLISEELGPVRQDGPQLNSLFNSCEKLLAVCRASVNSKRLLGLQPSQTELEFAELVERSGLGALAASNAMVLYTVASNRVTSRPEDKIYGIMQVFGFQLGVSAQNADVKAPVNLAHLELQLGKELIKQFPLMSQMHVHTQPTETGQAWRVSETSRVPELVSKVVFYVTDGFSNKHTLLSRLSYQEIDGCCWGSFSGDMCEFSKLASAWRSADRTIFGKHGKGGRSIQQIALDATNLIPDDIFTDKPLEDLPRDQRQHKLAAEIVSYLQHAKLEASILLLGRYRDDKHSDQWWSMSGGPIAEYVGDVFNIGLILLRHDADAEEAWRRLGICIWDLGHPAIKCGGQEKRILCGDSAEWKQEVKGLFG